MRYTFQFQQVWAKFDMLLQGIALTLQLSLVTLAFGVMLGIIAARLLTAGPKPVQMLVRGYVEVIRNTPLLIQLFLVFFGLPALGLRLDANTTAMVALVINMGAYTTEIVRAGIESVHKSQIEAGMSLALTPFQVFSHVILPPALQSVYPALASQFVLIMLATSVTSAISATELTSIANTIQGQNFRSLEVYIITAGLYLGLAIFFKLLLWIIGLVAFPRSRRQLFDMVAGQ